jgi:hypothetical protein
MVKIEIWGDTKYYYSGTLSNDKGESPHLMLQLDDDKQVFIKLEYYDNTTDGLKLLKLFTTFIPILKRYQSIP